MKSKSRGHFRSSPRPQIASKVTIRKHGLDDLVAYTRDVGMGGVFIETSQAFEMGDRLEVLLSAPSMWEPLVLRASVCRIETPREDSPGGVGLQFQDLSESQSVALGELTASLDYEE